MIRAIAFDMDGTLIDSKDAWYLTIRETVERFTGKALSYSEFQDICWGKSMFEWSLRFVEQEHMGDFIKECHSAFERHLDKIGLFTNEVEILGRLSNDYKLGIVTNTSSHTAKKIAQLKGIDCFFSLIIGGDMVKKQKPEPDGLLLLCRQLSVKKENCVYVGDQAYDIEAAVRAGIKSISFRREDKKADAVVWDFKEICDVVRKL
ncbi:hypothetical protein DRN74_02250 [Candidatus Micrarchaeota archaeon]|nr:MAG: hypothetical protein DRN74_02250 [Candidatus Micrarchaeota archaeon]